VTEPHRAGERQDAGFIAIELAIGIGLLLFPVAMLVLTLPTWSERQTAARSIARETARVAAVAGECDEGAARRLGLTMASNLGLPTNAVVVELDCATGSPLPRGGVVTSRVTARMPAVTIPGIGGVGGWSWTAVHHEPVDQYRSL
jgi:hypothetical protein